MKILITGANGQLGTDLLLRLDKSGAIVIPFDREALDITDARAIARVVGSLKPDAIINCAAYTKVDLAEKERDKAFSVNRDGPALLARTAQGHGAQLIHISTDFVFDGKKSSPYNEDDQTAALNVYGESKLAGEIEIARRMSEYAIIRASWLYGASGANFVKTIIRLASERERLNVVYDQVGAPTSTTDLSDAVIALLQRRFDGTAKSGVYHFSNEGVASWYDFAVAILNEARLHGLSLKCRSIEPILSKDYPTSARRPAYSVLDKTKIKKACGLVIPHWAAALKNTMSALYGKSYA
ncbi:MAG: dTDP-4-dehydrorhamnose reductase [Deltaproteobacteria bacterium]|nr:dTDP-4-dehydrorhamnose reductase [Deltaproteobacteria bacterium]